MGYIKYSCRELSKIINKLQKAYSKLNLENIPEYTKNLIITLKERNVSFMDIDIIVAASVTKNPKHLKEIAKTHIRHFDIHKYIKNVYDGGIQWIY